jgi:hypothetical protein
MNQRQEFPTGDALDPKEALDRLFEVIRDEAISNPSFGRRMLSAMGCRVVFTGSDALSAADPVLAAATMDYPAFREMFTSFAEKDLKALLTNFALATAEDVKAVKTRPKKIGYIDLMWDGAQRKLADRRRK